MKSRDALASAASSTNKESNSCIWGRTAPSIDSMPETIQKTAGLSTIDKLRMLLDITKTISRSLDLKEVLNLVMDTLDSLIPYDAAGIYLVKCSRPVSGGEDGADETCVFHTEAVRGYDI